MGNWSQLLAAPKVTQCYQSSLHACQSFEEKRSKELVWGGNSEQPVGGERVSGIMHPAFFACPRLHCTNNHTLSLSAVQLRFFNRDASCLSCLSSAQLMHFLLFVCSAAKQEKTPDDILGAAIRRFCSRLQRKFLIGGRQQLDLDFLVNKWDTALPTWKCSWRYLLLQHFDVHWRLIPPLCKHQQ